MMVVGCDCDTGEGDWFDDEGSIGMSDDALE